MMLAALAAVTLALPTTLQPLSATPPLGGGARFEVEGSAILHRVQTTERVDVRVATDGRPFAVAATQRLVVENRGDYSYTIGAPLLDVEPAPGSESQPGFRRDAIVWSGFVADRKVLAARATLRPRDAAESLPLELSLAGGRITLANATSVRAAYVVAPVERATMLRVLERTRRAVARGASVVGGDVLTATAATQTEQARVEAPLRVAGTIGSRRVDVVLGDGRPLQATFPAGPVRLTVTPVPPLALLRPRPGEDGEALVRRAATALQRLALVRQYRTFLGTPDPRGARSTTYVYRTAAAPRPVETIVPEHRRDLTPLWIALAAVVLAGGAVAWARS